MYLAELWTIQRWQMIQTKFGIFFMFLFCVVASCSGKLKQDKGSVDTLPVNQLVGGGCDGCELMFADKPEIIKSVDTSAGWRENGQKLLVTGTVYQLDGVTPAPGVLIYYWQTDHTGYYSPTVGMDDQVKRHGHIRGWVKTDDNGKYSVYTIRPAPYPNRNIPAHIHISIKEPDITNEYYIDELVFDDDKLLTSDKRKKMENRGGSGVLRVLASGNLQVAEHNVILELNISNYPGKLRSPIHSGLQIGEDSPSFTPYHGWGPDKGSRTCPVCKYGRYQGILFFVGNHPNWIEIKQWLLFLEKASITRGNI